MKQATFFKIAFMAGLISTIGLIGCGSDSKTSDNETQLFSDIVDSVALAVADEIAEPTGATASFASYGDDDISTNALLGEMYGLGEIAMNESMLYAVCQGGLASYDFATKKRELIKSEDQLIAVINHNGSIYAGGSKLYKLVDGSLVLEPGEFDGGINDLCSFGYRLLVGTNQGLYSSGIFGHEKLMEDINISAIASTGDAVWIGTDGEGLWRWDGDEVFHKRYLRRDSSLFDTVISLDYQHQHLYAGTVNGLHIYDGGKWKTYTVEDGLPSNSVLSIDARDWTTYIVTDGGVASLYNDVLEPVEGLEQYSVNRARTRGTRVILSTETEGLISKKGKAVKVLLPPTVEEGSGTLTVAD